MARRGETRQLSMDGMLQQPRNMMSHEWLSRRDEGQACELWMVNDGTDEPGGFQVLWVPEERVALALSHSYGDDGPVVRWWGHVTHARDFEQFFTPLRPPLVELPYYVGVATTCDQCGEQLDTASRALSGRLAEERGDDSVYGYICETCFQETGPEWLNDDA